MELWNRSIKVCVLVSALICIAATSASAQDTREKVTPSIRTSAEAIVTAVPDRARLDIGVTTQASDSKTAVSQNAQKLEATLSRLRSLLGASADIRTISYSVTPNYRYPKEGGEPSISGYTATNIVRVTIDDLTKVGDAIDAATQAGANRVQSLQFQIKDEQPHIFNALREAAIRARRKAESLASALGLKIVRVLSVSESGAPVIPLADASFARAEAASTPIEPGVIEIRASVTLTVEISQ